MRPISFENYNFKIICFSIFFAHEKLFQSPTRYVAMYTKFLFRWNSSSFLRNIGFVVVLRYVRVSLNRYAFHMDVLESRIMRSCGRQRGTQEEPRVPALSHCPVRDGNLYAFVRELRRHASYAIWWVRNFSSPTTTELHLRNSRYQLRLRTVHQKITRVLSRLRKTVSNSLSRDNPDYAKFLYAWAKSSLSSES